MRRGHGAPPLSLGSDVSRAPRRSRPVFYCSVKLVVYRWCPCRVGSGGRGAAKPFPSCVEEAVSGGWSGEARADAAADGDTGRTRAVSRHGGPRASGRTAASVRLGGGSACRAVLTHVGEKLRTPESFRSVLEANRLLMSSGVTRRFLSPTFGGSRELHRAHKTPAWPAVGGFWTASFEEINCVPGAVNSGSGAKG